MALGALEDLPGRPDGLVTHRTLDGGKDDGHLGRLGAGHLEVLAADPASQGVQGAAVAGGDAVRDRTVSSGFRRSETARRIRIDRMAPPIPEKQVLGYRNFDTGASYKLWQ